MSGNIFQFHQNFTIGYQCLSAYVVALCVYQIGMLVTEGVFGAGTMAALILIAGIFYLLFRPYKESDTLTMDVAKVVAAK